MEFHKKNHEGNSAELLVAAYLTKLGNQVFFPSMSQSRADLIYVNYLEPVKVQVKTATKSVNGHQKWVYEQTRISREAGPGYKIDEIDEFWIVGTHLWCFPGDLIAGRKTLLLGSNNPKPYRARSTDYNPNEFIRIRGSWKHPFRDRLMMNEEE